MGICSPGLHVFCGFGKGVLWRLLWGCLGSEEYGVRCCGPSDPCANGARAWFALPAVSQTCWVLDSTRLEGAQFAGLRLCFLQML